MLQDAPFASTDYQLFVQNVRRAIELTREEDPYSVAVQKVLPAIAEGMNALGGTVHSGFTRHDAKIDSIESRVIALQQSQDESNTRMYTLVVSPNRTRTRLLPQGYDCNYDHNSR